MAARVVVTEASLRAAMRQPRYWRDHHPERRGFVEWVTGGWRAFVAAEAGASATRGGGLVSVRAYTRTRRGKAERVGAHTRAAPAGGDHAVAGGTGEAAAMSYASRPSLSATRAVPGPTGAWRVVPAQGLLLTPRPPMLFSRPPVLPPGPRTPMQRVPRQSGKEAATDTPSWFPRFPRWVGETPVQYATRAMDGRYGPGNWPRTRDQAREFGKIQKYGSRAFRDPSLAPFGLFDEEA